MTWSNIDRDRRIDLAYSHVQPGYNWKRPPTASKPPSTCEWAANRHCRLAVADSLPS